MMGAAMYVFAFVIVFAKGADGFHFREWASHHTEHEDFCDTEQPTKVIECELGKLCSRYMIEYRILNTCKHKLLQNRKRWCWVGASTLHSIIQYHTYERL